MYPKSLFLLPDLAHWRTCSLHHRPQILYLTGHTLLVSMVREAPFDTIQTEDQHHTVERLAGTEIGTALQEVGAEGLRSEATSIVENETTLLQTVVVLRVLITETAGKAVTSHRLPPLAALAAHPTESTIEGETREIESLIEGSVVEEEVDEEDSAGLDGTSGVVAAEVVEAADRVAEGELLFPLAHPGQTSLVERCHLGGRNHLQVRFGQRSLYVSGLTPSL